MLKRPIVAGLLATTLILQLAACGGRPATAPEAPLGAAQGAGLPALPRDGAQPWEPLDAQGRVVPPERAARSLNAASEFSAGVERFLEGGGVSDLGEASRLQSGSQGGQAMAWAMYRVPLAGQQPGALALDVNLNARSGAPAGTPSAYYLGLSDYAKGAWEWHGPFSDSHVRLGRAAAGSADPEYQLASADYLSGLGNLFVTVLAFDGAAVDVVGLGVNPLAAADSTAPAAPAALAATPQAQALLLEWTPSAASDLAGYRVYYSNNAFSSPGAAGVKALPYLIGGTSVLYPTAATRHLRVSAVDISGNESALSPDASAAPLAGSLPALLVSTDITGGPLNAAATVSVSSPTAGLQYEFDLDGDGSFDVGPTSASSQSIDTSAPGIIRPAVRASSGAAVALGSVSLIVSGNSRPAVVAYASPSSGTAPLNVSLDGAAEDSDGTIAEYAWDYTGDGIFDFTSSTGPATTRNYTGAGVKNAKLRATDNDGDWAVDSAVIVVEDSGTGGTRAVFSGTPPECNVGETVYFDAAASTAASGTITKYEWDLNGDGAFEKDTGAVSNTTKTFSLPGNKVLQLRITTSTNATASASLDFVVHGWGTPLEVAPGGTQPQYSSLKVVNGRPAIAYYDLGFDGGAYYIRADNADGTSWGDPVPVDTSGNCWYPRLELVAGRPAVCFYDNTVQKLKYVRATDSDGTAFGAVKLADPNSDRGPYCSMAVVNGRPAIAYQDNGMKDLYYVRASDSTGSAWGAPQPLSTADDTGMFTSLAVVNGRPAIAFHDNTTHELRYVRANNADGSGAWGSELILDGDAVTIAGQYNTLQVVAGVPCVAYSYLATADLRFVRAFDADGSLWGFITPPDSAGAVGTYASMALVAGRPVIAYLNGGGGYVAYVAADDDQGSDWGTPQYFPPPGNTTDMSICAVNGNAAISYINVNTNKLTYAKLY